MLQGDSNSITAVNFAFEDVVRPQVVIFPDCALVDVLGKQIVVFTHPPIATRRLTVG